MCSILCKANCLNHCLLLSIASGAATEGVDTMMTKVEVSVDFPEGEEILMIISIRLIDPMIYHDNHYATKR